LLIRKNLEDSKPQINVTIPDNVSNTRNVVFRVREIGPLSVVEADDVHTWQLSERSIRKNYQKHSNSGIIPSSQKLLYEVIEKLIVIKYLQGK